ncbi:TPA: hypothetical protein ACV4ZA_002056, partial [Streptococcus agalactiae]
LSKYNIITITSRNGSMYNKNFIVFFFTTTVFRRRINICANIATIPALEPDPIGKIKVNNNTTPMVIIE